MERSVTNTGQKGTFCETIVKKCVYPVLSGRTGERREFAGEKSRGMGADAQGKRVRGFARVKRLIRNPWNPWLKNASRFWFLFVLLCVSLMASLAKGGPFVAENAFMDSRLRGNDREDGLSRGQAPAGMTTLRP